ncbi:hypothetical protein [Bacillus bombysepticus]|uniref:tetratricopeptide repeat protein n=1 Tax=Bacillus bombysepticus TaxID=658666 RepID=UPI003017531C
MSEENVINLYNPQFYQQRAQEFVEESLMWIGEGKWIKAKECVEQAIELNPVKVEYMSLAAHISYELGEFELAEFYMEQVVKERHMDDQLQYVYGVILLKVKKFDEAQNVFEGLLNWDVINDPDNIERRSIIMYCLYEINFEKKEFNRAMEILEAIKIEKQINVDFEMASLNWLEGNFKKAIIHGEEALVRYPDRIILYGIVVDSFKELDEYEKALEWLRQKQEEFPDLDLSLQIKSLEQ